MKFPSVCPVPQPLPACGLVRLQRVVYHSIINVDMGAPRCMDNGKPCMWNKPTRSTSCADFDIQGRAGYGATLDGLWPYTYDACDVGTVANQTRNGLPHLATVDGDATNNGALSFLPGQRLSRCTCAGESHPGPMHADGTFVGRSSPEIDVFEVRNSKYLVLCKMLMYSSVLYRRQCLVRHLFTVRCLRLLNGR